MEYLFGEAHANRTWINLLNFKNGQYARFVVVIIEAILDIYLHDYPTRHVNDLNLTNNKKFFSDHSIRTNGPILWNSLSKTLKESKTIRYFRNQFKLKLIQTYE